MGEETASFDPSGHSQHL